jgi:hypothetical protein
MDTESPSREHYDALEEAVKPCVFLPKEHMILTNIYSLLVQSQQISKEIRIIQKEPLTRPREKKEAGYRRDVWVAEQEIRAAIRPFAKDACLALCKSIHKALPREIRDMIYGYTHAHDTIYVGPEYFEKTVIPCESDRKAHYWDVEYVGNETRVEMIESWYRTTLFYFYDKASNAKVIEQFLVTDRWACDIKPRDFICRARIDLSVNDVLHSKYERYSSSSSCCVVQDAGRKLIRPLKHFDQLPNNVEFFIRIQTYNAPQAGCMNMAEVRNAIEVVVNQLKTLQTAGHRIIIQWPDLNNIELSWKTTSLLVPEWTTQLELAAHLALG